MRSRRQEQSAGELIMKLTLQVFLYFFNLFLR